MSNHNPLQKLFYASVATTALLGTSNAHSEDEISLYNPHYKGGLGGTVTLQCDTIKNGMTCDFMEALDGQEICDDNKILEQVNGDQRQASNLTTMMAIVHNGDMHRHCTSHYGLTLINNLLDETNKLITSNTPITQKELNSLKGKLFQIHDIETDSGTSPRLQNGQTLSEIATNLRDNLNANNLENIMKTFAPMRRDPVWKKLYQSPDDCIPLKAKDMCEAELAQ